jgi:3-isopropylmalate/(R)-2-methylmalate dehydratase large subunit
MILPAGAAPADIRSRCTFVRCHTLRRRRGQSHEVPRGALDALGVAAYYHGFFWQGCSMGMTIAEKILARASGRAKVAPGDLVTAKVDTAVMIDTNFYPSQWRQVFKVHDPSKIVVVFDHRIPAPDRTVAKMHMAGRTFVKQFGIKRFHDVGSDQGIAHVIASERAYALPGTVLVCSDSHTASGGVMNCAARGVGFADLMYTVTKGSTWFQVCPTVRYDLVGKLRPGVFTKDVFLMMAQQYGDHTGQNVEYGGPGMANLSLEARRTLTTMGTEINAEFSIVEPDELLLSYVRKQTTAAFTEQYPDRDATYVDRRTIDLSTVEPLVAKPDVIIRNAVPVNDVAGEAIQQAFIGSCANGSIDDFAAAAQVLKGRRVASGVRLLITPGSQDVYRAALKAGYVGILVEAGAVVTNATCGACGGGHLGVLAPGEVCITASTRNFKGRMGDPSARIYMASPATVAASALAGVITSPLSYFTGAEAA